MEFVNIITKHFSCTKNTFWFTIILLLYQNVCYSQHANSPRSNTNVTNKVNTISPISTKIISDSLEVELIKMLKLYNENLQNNLKPEEKTIVGTIAEGSDKVGKPIGLIAAIFGLFTSIPTILLTFNNLRKKSDGNVIEQPSFWGKYSGKIIIAVFSIVFVGSFFYFIYVAIYILLIFLLLVFVIIIFAYVALGYIKYYDNYFRGDNSKFRVVVNREIRIDDKDGIFEKKFTELQYAMYSIMTTSAATVTYFVTDEIKSEKPLQRLAIACPDLNVIHKLNLYANKILPDLQLQYPYTNPFYINTQNLQENYDAE